MNQPTYESARERLRDALDPQTDAERATVVYLAATMKRQVSTLIGMVERATSRARAEGYERGWTEAGGVQ
jgi:hypothetical protein